MEKIEEKILEQFLFNKRLKFNQIEKKINERSNKIAYHLKKLVEKNILQKENDYYIFSESSEYLIPYISEKKSLLPVILVYIGDKKKAFLYEREKRPYESCLSLPGGRIVLGESIAQATGRIMKKFNIDAKLKEIHSVSLENVKKKGKIIHSFFLIFVSAKTKDKIGLTNILKNKNKIIPSDFKLLQKDLGKTLEVKNINVSVR